MILIVLMILVAPLVTNQAIAAGAVAVGIAPGGVSRGYASGYAVNQPNTDAAKTTALAECKKLRNNVSGTAPGSGTAAAKAMCEVVGTFANKCYAESLDPMDGTPGVGWAIADTQQQADDEALARCRSTAGTDRRAFCKVTLRACDGGSR
ncbi:MAG TPA: DUF4189 domain-containing protein [Xanthobacteraceae bacterium]|nr:DUF4189 domain-containing protein [Xanthobacteraceae bacterium]